MSLESNKALVLRLFEAINSGDFAALEAHPGFWQTREVVPPMHAIFHDWRTTHIQQIAEDDRVFTYLALEFTHVGPFAGQAPTGRRVALQGCSIDRVVDGIVVEHNSTVTWPGVLRQIGVPQFQPWPLHSPRRLSLPAAAHPGLPAANRQTLEQLPLMIVQNRVSAAALRNGVGATRDEFQAIHSAFPNLEVSFVGWLVEGDLVGAWSRLHGTQLGPLWGFKPTGKTITWDQFSLARVADGAVVEYLGALDWTAALIQLGLFPTM